MAAGYGALKIESPPEGGRRAERRVQMRNLSQSEYRSDRAVVNSLRCAGRVLGLPPKALASLPRGELRRLLKRARGRAEREWDAISRRIDALVGLEDLLREGRLP